MAVTRVPANRRELIARAATVALGAAIWLAWETLRTEELFANLVVIASLGATFNFLLQRLSQRLVPWQVERPR